MSRPATTTFDLESILTGDDPARQFSDEELIPVRMLNEFTYCPRLAYLEWVQGEFTDNLDTRQGTFGHRNVDKPSRAAVPASADMTRNVAASSSLSGLESSVEDDSKPADSPLLKTRSITLSAYHEGLVAKLDVLELEGHVATPVEFKKGAIPSNPERSWEPERVQLCAQGLILRENGYRCESGELYYIESHQRVVIEFDDVLVMRTRELIKQLRELSQTEQIPPPLVDSPKCPRCSLVGICLPDETNLLIRDQSPPIDAAGSQLKAGTGSNRIGTASQNLRPVRQLVPARDDALPLYVKEQGASVGKDGDRLVVRNRDAKLISVPMIEVSQVSLFGNVQMSSQLIREVVDRGIPICHFSYGGWFSAITTGHDNKNIELRIAQFAAAADPTRSLALAKGFITAKIKNCRTMLRRHGGAKEAVETRVESSSSLDGPPSRFDLDNLPVELISSSSPSAADEEVGDQGDAFGDDSRAMARSAPPKTFVRDLDQLMEWIQKAARAPSAESLLGLEGMAAKVYFAGYAKILKGGQTFDFTGRNRRPPRDPINALLSFVYSLLTKEVTIALRSVGFDPLLGFFHKPRYGRPSLALDLAEEFRPIIGDSTVMTLVNNGEVTPSSFVSRAGSVTLTEAGRKAVIAAFERRMEHEITHPIFGYKISYRRVLEVQARLLSRVVLGELHEYPGFCTR